MAMIFLNLFFVVRIASLLFILNYSTINESSPFCTQPLSHRCVASSFIVWLCMSHVAVQQKTWCGRTTAGLRISVSLCIMHNLTSRYLIHWCVWEVLKIIVMHLFLVCQHCYQSVCVTELCASVVYLSFPSSHAGVEYLSNDCTVYSELVRINPTIWCTFPPVAADIISLHFLIFKIWRFYKLLHILSFLFAIVENLVICLKGMSETLKVCLKFNKYL
jgi:hypothetical protein